MLHNQTKSSPTAEGKPERSPSSDGDEMHRHCNVTQWMQIASGCQGVSGRGRGGWGGGCRREAGSIDNKMQRVCLRGQMKAAGSG